ncbi:hypothetical protein GJAV_G00039710 [Gymnothorax javanicus]|nr:hypothetical protein GJAV_G00039710 [Gymnothorax javanicus]
MVHHVNKTYIGSSSMPSISPANQLGHLCSMSRTWWNSYMSKSKRICMHNWPRIYLPFIN